MAIFHPPVVKLIDHCASLSKVLHSLSYKEPTSMPRGDETYGWSQPAEWLDLAASIVEVQVVTAQGDDSLMMCGSAMDYENDRSALLSQFATSLTIFSFLWGAFESVAKIMDPKAIPKADRKDGNDTLTARVAYALRLVKPDGVYQCRLANLRYRMASMREYKDCIPEKFIAIEAAEAGEGIDLVRRIRNKFAHGAAVLPQRHDWDGNNSIDNQMVRLSCRMVLLTIQMMLRVHFTGQSFPVEIYQFGSDPDDEYEIHSVLETLHIVPGPGIDDFEQDGNEAASE